MGVMKDQGSEMAITLAGLSGDLASFWNTSAEQAKNALRGIYTGETESLKEYGIAMTEVNLSAFALSQGIKKQYNEMSQAEKILVRYQYVLQATADAQGDFAKTSDSWANQTRILKEQWNQLLTIIGKGFISVLTPVVKALNNLLATAINVANTISDAFSRIFGTKKQTFSLETKDSVGNIGDVTDAVEDTTESVEELKKELELLPFDELNKIGQIKVDTDLGDTDTEFDQNLVVTEEQPEYSLAEDLEEQSSRIDAILQTIADKIKEWKDKLPKLNLHFDLDSFLDNLTRLTQAFINTFANILGAATEFGINLLNSINFDAVITNLTNAGISLLNTFETIAVTVIDILGRIVEDLQFGKLIEQVTEVIASFANLADQATSVLAPAFINFYEVGLSPVVTWIGEKLSSALTLTRDLLDDWASWFTDNADGIANFGTALGELVNVLWSIVEPIADEAWIVFTDTLTLISELLQTIGEYFLNEFVPQLQEFLDEFLGDVMPQVQEFAQSINELMTELQPILEALIEVISELLLPLLGNELLSALDQISNVLNTILGIAQSFVQVITGIVQFLVGVFTGDWDMAWEGIQNIAEGAFSRMGTVIEGILDGIVSNVESAVNQIKTLFQGISDIASNSSTEFKFSGFNSGLSAGIGGILGGITGRSYSLAPIPKLASGGVLYGDTVAMMGEYPGASNNPEIVTPQNIMRDTVEQANAGVINAVMAMGNKVTKAIEDKNTDVYMDSLKVTRKVMENEDKVKKQKGTTLVNK